MSITKYIQNAKDTFDSYKKFYNRKNAKSYEEKVNEVDQIDTNNNSKLTNSSDSSDCEYLKSSDLSGYHMRNKTLNETKESSEISSQSTFFDPSNNHAEFSIENPLDATRKKDLPDTISEKDLPDTISEKDLPDTTSEKNLLDVSLEEDHFSNSSSSTSSDDEPDKKLLIKERLIENDMVCKDKEYVYFDQKDDSEKEQETEEIVLDGDCYKTRKDALNWNNISKLILDNATYFGLSETEANKAVIELNKLILTPFSTIKSYNQTAVCPESNFMNFWSIISELTIDGIRFENISKIAFRLWPIPPSEAGAERAYSKIKWKFPDRRNRLKDSTMMDEIFVEDAYQQKVNNDNNFSEAMWQLPQHST